MGLWRHLVSRAALIELAVLALGGLATLFLSGYGRIDLHRPARIAGDHLFVVTYAKSYIEGHGFRFNAQLGFPDVQDSLRFPSFDATYRIWLWLEARVMHNPFAAVHGLYIAGILAMFGFSYWALRRFEVSRWISALGAAAMVLTPFLTVRAYAHDFLALQYSVPLGLACALDIGMSTRWRRLQDFLKDPFVLTAIGVVGSSGLYYAFYSVMFAVFAGTACAVGQRRWFPILAASSFAVPVFIVLILAGYGLDLPLVLNGTIVGPHRFPFEQLVYGMEINSAGWSFQFIPKVAKDMSDALAQVPPAFVNDLHEWPAAPLALVILASPLIAAIGLQASASREPAASSPQRRLITLSAIVVTFGLLFAVNGGLGFLFNMMVTPEIRADERLMPFITFAAIVVVASGAEAAMGLTSVGLRYGAAVTYAALLIWGMVPQFGGLAKIQKGTLADAASQQLLASTNAMLQVKNKASLGAVLELPLGSWPEQAPVHSLDLYQHQLPFILDRPGSPTRWSYGANDRQAWFPMLQFALNDPNGAVGRMRAMGFDSMLIEKRGYDAGELQTLQAKLGAQLSPSCLLFDDERMALYALKRDLGGRTC